MAIRTYKVTLDSKNTIAPEPVYLRQGDKTGAVVIDATLIDNGDHVSLDGLKPMFKANTADGQAVIADSTGFNIVNASGGEFTYQVPNALSSVPGKITTAYFSFSDSSGSESTFDVAFIIKKSVDITHKQAEDYITIIDGTLDSLRDQMNSLKIDLKTTLNNYNTGNFYNKSETDSRDSTTLSSAKSYTDNSLKGISSVPETFANWTAIKAKYPNGANGVMVAADNGHKYIWANNVWTDAGVYQSVGIADGSVAPIKLMPNTSNGMLIASGPVKFDTKNRTISIPQGTCSINYNGRWVKYIDQKNVTGVGQGGFITADVSGDKATLSYKEGAKLTNNDVIVGGIIEGNLTMNAKMAIAENDVPTRVTSGMVLSGAPVRYENQKLIFSADTAFYSRNDYFVKKPFVFDLPEKSGYFFANHSTQEIGFANGGDLHTGKYNEDWFMFGGIMQGVPYINGSLISGPDKFYLYLGDSITEGFRTSDEAVNNYPREVYNINHRLFRRYSVTGSTIAAPQDGKSFVERAKNIDFSEGTDIVIFGGHNDYKAGKQLGSLDSKDETTVLGALNSIVAKIYADNPSAKIKIISPNWRVVNENDPTNPNNNDIDSWKNSAGLMFKDYVTALNQFAESHGFPILNLRKEWAVNKLNQKQWLVDGLHPNDAGQRFLGETVERFLR